MILATPAATDDHLDVCDGVHALCRIDLAQDKRGHAPVLGLATVHPFTYRKAR